MSNVKSAKIKLDPPLVVSNNISKFQTFDQGLLNLLHGNPNIMDGRKDGRTDKGKTKLLPSPYGGGIKTIT